MPFSDNPRRPDPGLRPDPKDRETILQLLEIAALCITTVKRTTFTREELLAEARACGGEDCQPSDADFDAALADTDLFEAHPGGLMTLK